MIHYGRQNIDKDDVEAVLEVLKSDYLTTGPQVEAFEDGFAEKIGAKYAVAVSSGTAALHLAMLVLNIGKGDRVVTSPNTFLASANCAAFVGATPDFCDIDKGSYNLSPVELEKNWKNDTRAVIAVDYAGQPCNMPEISRIARSKGAYVVEDASHAVGTRFEYEGKVWATGSHPWADLTVFSFHPVKTITTAEGGVITTHDICLAEELRKLRNHGIIRDSGKWLGLDDSNDVLDERGGWYYEMQSLGYNYRISDLQCALGRSQLHKLDAFIKRRIEIVSAYNAGFSDIHWIETPSVSDCFEYSEHTHISWHLYTVLIDFKKIRLSRTELMKCLREQGIGTQVLYIPVHLQPWYREKYGYGIGKCPVSEELYTRYLSLPLHPGLTDSEISFIVRSVIEIATS